MRRPLVVAFGFTLLTSAPFAWAQSPGTGSMDDKQGGQGQQGPQGAPSGASTAKPPPPNPNQNSGYSYTDKPARPSGGGGRKAHVVKHTGPVVNLPGFEQLGDGGSRVFVSLTQTVPVEEHKAQGSVTYVLKGAGVRVWNNTNALVTVHFNTPVSRARLVPHGNDVHLVIDLRAASSPTYKMTGGQDKSAVLQVDFPKGDFAPAEKGDIPVNDDNKSANDNGDGTDTPAATAPKRQGGRRRTGKGAAPPKPGPNP